MNIIEHLTRNEMNDLKNGKLSMERRLLALDHIGKCTYCAEVFANIYEENELLHLTPDFTNGLLEKLQREGTGSQDRKTVYSNKKRELYTYGFKVSIAACAALILLFTGAFNNSMVMIEKNYIANTDLKGANVITESLRGFSDRLVNLDFDRPFNGGDKND